MKNYCTCNDTSENCIPLVNWRKTAKSSSQVTLNYLKEVSWNEMVINGPLLIRPEIEKQIQKKPFHPGKSSIPQVCILR